jgi:hypothetical protein
VFTSSRRQLQASTHRPLLVQTVVHHRQQNMTLGMLRTSCQLNMAAGPKRPSSMVLVTLFFEGFDFDGYRGAQPPPSHSQMQVQSVLNQGCPIGEAYPPAPDRLD